MQQAFDIQNATINAIANIQFGTAAVVTNAAALAPLSSHHLVSKCSPPSKSGGGGSLERWRGEGSMRSPRPEVRPYQGLSVPVVGSTDLPIVADAVMPPQVWAQWVLSRSLCG